MNGLMNRRKRRRSNYAILLWWGAVASVAIVSHVYSPVLAIGQLRPGRDPCCMSETRRYLLEDRHGRIHFGRLPNSECSHSSGIRVRDSWSKTDSNASTEKEREFFISDAQVVHLSSAARILTEEFYSHRTNFITFQIERLKTVLSLESTFPNQRSSLRNEHTRRTLQRMIVACDARNGQVVGFAEVDARPLVGNRSTVSENESSPNEGTTSDDILRSYMYNLAVDKKWKRKGIASALVHACERFVGDTHDLCVEKRLYLRVRKSNLAAIALYESLGYRAMSPEVIHMSKEDINSGSLEDGELILFAKDLPIAGECLLD